MNEVLLEKEFANSIALHIDTDAKQAFISNTLKNNIEATKKVLAKLFVVGIIVVFLTIVLQKITLSLDREGIVLLYSFLAIIIASSADIAHALATSKKQK